MKNLVGEFSSKLFLVLTMMILAIAFLVSPAFASEIPTIDFISDNVVWFGLLFVVVEYILGKTELVKSGSTLELVINSVIGILKKLAGQKLK